MAREKRERISGKESKGRRNTSRFRNQTTRDEKRTSSVSGRTSINAHMLKRRRKINQYSPYPIGVRPQALARWKRYHYQHQQFVLDGVIMRSNQCRRFLGLLPLPGRFHSCAAGWFAPINKPPPLFSRPFHFCVLSVY
jgi:hypothetical protein